MGQLGRPSPGEISLYHIAQQFQVIGPMTHFAWLGNVVFPPLFQSTFSADPADQPLQALGRIPIGESVQQLVKPHQLRHEELGNAECLRSRYGAANVTPFVYDLRGDPIPVPLECRQPVECQSAERRKVDVSIRDHL